MAVAVPDEIEHREPGVVYITSHGVSNIWAGELCRCTCNVNVYTHLCSSCATGFCP